VSRALWEIIVPAWDEMSALIAKAIPAQPAASPPAHLDPQPVLGAALLDPLRAAVHDRLDERVLSLLRCADKLVWHRLQDDVLGEEDGGEAFYSRLDHLLRAGVDPPSIVLEVYYFCLDDGFKGRFDDAAPIEAYKRRIEQHLTPPPAVVAGTVPAMASPPATAYPLAAAHPPAAAYPPATVLPSVTVPPRAASAPARAAHPGRSPAFYYVATAILVVLIVVLPIALSNL
jgi:hypothetical protein